MPHGSLKIKPGVDQTETQALNEAAVSISNLIRFFPDRNGLGLVQKLGGWVRWFPNQFSSPVRDLHAWQDLNNIQHMSVGCEESLEVVTNNSSKDITPTTIDEPSVVVDVDTTIGSNLAKITVTGSNLQLTDSVYVLTPISVGGLVISGLYPVVLNNGVNAFTVAVYDLLGQPTNATSTVAAGGVVPEFTTTASQAAVTVTFPDHGLSVGSTAVFLVSTTLATITISGQYVVSQVIDANNYTINATNVADASTSAFMNGGDAAYLFYIGIAPPTAGSGFGIGGFGSGGFGSGSTIPAGNTGTPITATDWFTDNWGEILIACPQDGSIFAWSPNSSTSNATVIPYAPAVNGGVFVAMPQRQLVAWGSTVNGVKDPLLIRWCDNEDFTIWIGAADNQAGSYRIPNGSEIVSAIQGPQQGLVFTDLGVWAMVYTGYPYVYSFNLLANGCGLIARKAVAMLGNSVYWMSQKQFNVLVGNGTQSINCPIWDVVFQDLNEEFLNSIRCATNSLFNEVTWYYVSKGATEIDSYVKYNTLFGQWDYGRLDRTAWTDQSVLGPPIGAGTDRYLYQHEVGNDANGMPMGCSFTTGYFAMTEGNDILFIDQVWPDMKWGYFGQDQNASVQITFYVTDYPGDTPRVFGPFNMAQTVQFITPRFRGRLVAINISSNDVGSFWRLGNIRYRYQPDGRF